MTSNKKVRVAIVGVGNCASSLVQGVQYYREAKPEDFVPGLMHVNLGGYHISDIEFSQHSTSTRTRWVKISAKQFSLHLIIPIVLPKFPDWEQMSTVE